MAKTQANSVATKATASAPMLSSMEEFAGAGAENITSKDVSLPFLKILTNNSPQVTQGDSKFISKARPGMVINSVLNKLYNGQDGFSVVPCFFKFEYVEWADRGTQNSVAPVNSYPADSDIMSKTTRGEDRKDRLPNGNYIEPTHYHYVMMVDENDQPSETAVIVMKATQAKKSKKWNSMMLSQRRKGKSGFFQPPTWSQIYKLRTVLEKNSLGSWFGWEIEHEKDIPNDTLMNGAMAFYETCKKGNAKVNLSEDQKQETGTADSPF
jgi:hypothetical protein|tara:strand:+ start:3092 stop:3892 length:801 start_codon:yes stop_codon:yes gene_type:complete